MVPRKKKGKYIPGRFLCVQFTMVPRNNEPMFFFFYFLFLPACFSCFVIRINSILPGTWYFDFAVVFFVSFFLPPFFRPTFSDKYCYFLK